MKLLAVRLGILTFLPFCLAVSNCSTNHGGGGDSDSDIDSDTDADTDSETETQPGHQGASRPECLLDPPGVDYFDIEVHEAGWSAPERLPAPVNTNCPEDCAEISGDGSSLLFCWWNRIYSDEEWEEYVMTESHGTYLSVLEGGIWTHPKFQDLGRGWDWTLDNSTSTTSDGDTVFFHSIRDGNTALIETFYVLKTDDGWTEATRLPDEINNGQWAGEPGISPDGNALLFASSREGTEGGNDLWFSERDGDGWTTPVSLHSLNTVHDEKQVFVRSDGAQMYFVSDGPYHPSPGIYRSERANFESWGEGAWGPPQWIVSGGVGEPSVTSDGNSLYFTHVVAAGPDDHLDVDIYVLEKE